MDPQEIRVELVRITMQLEEIREQETWQKVSSNFGLSICLNLKNQQLPR
jgi:hypothetical protein